MALAPLSVWRNLSKAVIASAGVPGAGFRRYVTNLRNPETNLSHSITPSSPLSKIDKENFSVATRLLPMRARRHLRAIYVFARLVDDIGDEAAGDRIALLDKVSQDLDRIYSGKLPRNTILHDVAYFIKTCAIPRAPFDALINANYQDQRIHRYATYTDLVDYCTLSANPVGHMVLYAFGQATLERITLADRICTALQILEHCQDVVEDLNRGRVYLPQEDLDLFGVTEMDLKSVTANSETRALLAFQTQRALRLLDEGAPLVNTLHGAAKLAVSGYVAGGMATAKAIADARYDVLSQTPRPNKIDVLRYWSGLLARRSNR